MTSLREGRGREEGCVLLGHSPAGQMPAEGRCSSIPGSPLIYCRSEDFHTQLLIDWVTSLYL
ncbi:hypothetical protein M413DRAFT_447321 [Hebeloma cylindrosporum]|uniref:Uncharacterized protein n=1 Tax=Hebeloma cylindrosporum TaxID=76867 RepID=A0A0C3C3W1_HEBCY|nr:hypothetical protein M413DRAFT_447321 [Hebeloma cylindrosporum h7]